MRSFLGTCEYYQGDNRLCVTRNSLCISCTRSYARCNSGSTKFLLGQSPYLSVFRSRAKPDRFLIPASAAPRGFALGRAGELGLMLRLRYGVTLRADGSAQQRVRYPAEQQRSVWRSHLDIELSIVSLVAPLDNLPKSVGEGTSPASYCVCSWHLLLEAGVGGGIEETESDCGDLAPR